MRNLETGRKEAAKSNVNALDQMWAFLVETRTKQWSLAFCDLEHSKDAFKYVINATTSHKWHIFADFSRMLLTSTIDKWVQNFSGHLANCPYDCL